MPWTVWIVPLRRAPRRCWRMASPRGPGRQHRWRPGDPAVDELDRQSGSVHGDDRRVPYSSAI